MIFTDFCISKIMQLSTLKSVARSITFSVGVPSTLLTRLWQPMMLTMSIMSYIDNNDNKLFTPAFLILTYLSPPNEISTYKLVKDMANCHWNINHKNSNGQKKAIVNQLIVFGRLLRWWSFFAPNNFIYLASTDIYNSLIKVPHSPLQAKNMCWPISLWDLQSVCIIWAFSTFYSGSARTQLWPILCPVLRPMSNSHA